MPLKQRSLGYSRASGESKRAKPQAGSEMPEVPPKSIVTSVNTHLLFMSVLPWEPSASSCSLYGSLCLHSYSLSFGVLPPSPLLPSSPPVEFFHAASTADDGFHPFILYGFLLFA